MVEQDPQSEASPFQSFQQLDPTFVSLTQRRDAFRADLDAYGEMPSAAPSDMIGRGAVIAGELKDRQEVLELAWLGGNGDIDSAADVLAIFDTPDVPSGTQLTEISRARDETQERLLDFDGLEAKAGNDRHYSRLLHSERFALLIYRMTRTSDAADEYRLKIAKRQDYERRTRPGDAIR